MNSGNETREVSITGILTRKGVSNGKIHFLISWFILVTVLYTSTNGIESVNELKELQGRDQYQTHWIYGSNGQSFRYNKEKNIYRSGQRWRNKTQVTCGLVIIIVLVLTTVIILLENLKASTTVERSPTNRQRQDKRVGLDFVGTRQRINYYRKDWVN